LLGCDGSVLRRPRHNKRYVRVTHVWKERGAAPARWLRPSFAQEIAACRSPAPSTPRRQRRPSFLHPRVARGARIAARRADEGRWRAARHADAALVQYARVLQPCIGVRQRKAARSAVTSPEGAPCQEIYHILGCHQHHGETERPRHASAFALNAETTMPRAKPFCRQYRVVGARPARWSIRAHAASAVRPMSYAAR